ncbi:MAG: hypothetical protein ACK4K0_04025 [Flavobacteriales bacterium]
MKSFTLAVFFITGLTALNAQEFSSGGAAAAAQGGSSLFMSDAFSFYNNQAGLVWVSAAEAGVFVENRFLVNELNRAGGVFVLPTEKSGVFGFGFSSFGYSLYSRSKVGFAYARQLGSNISGGVQLNYHRLRFGNNYGNKGVPSVDLGMQALLTKELAFAFQLINPTQSKITDAPEERIPTILRIGLGYRASEKTLITSEVEKDMFYPASVKAGIEYLAGERIFFRAGISSNPNRAAFGFGLLLKSVRIDFASQYHQVLGFTPTFNLSYNFKGEKQGLGVWQNR